MLLMTDTNNQFVIIIILKKSGVFNISGLQIRFLKVKVSICSTKFFLIVFSKTCFRVEKTEVLSDDLQTSEKKVELVKHVSSNTVKKLGASLLGAGTSDPEKKLVGYLFQSFSIWQDIIFLW